MRTDVRMLLLGSYIVFWSGVLGAGAYAEEAKPPEYSLPERKYLPEQQISASETFTLRTGEDWSSPAWVKNSPHGGMGYLWWPVPIKDGFNNPYCQLYTVTVWWDKVNAKEGEYDWHEIDSTLTAIAAAGKKTQLIIVNWNQKRLPPWLRKKMPQVKTEMVNFWHPEYRQAYKSFIAACGQKYGKDPRVKYVRMCLYQSGESTVQVSPDKARKLYGYLPNGHDINEYTSEIIATYQKNFPHAKLLMTSGWTSSFSQLAWLRKRGGFFNGSVATTFFNALIYGAFYQAYNQKMIFPYPPRSILLPEWEGEDMVTNFGKDDNRGDLTYEKTRYLDCLSASYHAKYMNTCAWFFCAGEEKYRVLGKKRWIPYWPEYPSHFGWMNKQLGTSLEDAPEAFIVLGQISAPMRPDLNFLQKRHNRQPVAQMAVENGRQKSRITVNNAERFMNQDIMLDGSLPAKNHVIKNCGFGLKNLYIARTTDLKNQKDSFFFNIDDRYIFENSPRVIVKVVYYDQGQFVWQLEYDGIKNGKRGVQLVTQAVTSSDSGEIRTAIFILNDANFGNNLAGCNDLRIRNQGPDDLTVRMIRVIKSPALNTPIIKKSNDNSK